MNGIKHLHLFSGNITKRNNAINFLTVCGKGIVFRELSNSFGFLNDSYSFIKADCPVCLFKQKGGIK